MYSIKGNLQESLNWDVITKPVYDGNGNVIEGFKHLTNSESGDTIALHKSSYQEITNDRLESFVQSMLDNTDFKLEGYATYEAGQKVMAYLKNDNPPLFGGQKTQDYLVIGNSHDGSTAFFTGMTNVVHRCTNMFSKRNMQSRIRHTMSAEQMLKVSEETHDLYYNQQTGIYEMADKMVATKVTYEEKDDFLHFVLGIKKEEKLSTRGNNIRAKLAHSIDRETGDLGNNLFGLLNGATHYTTHVLKQKHVGFGSLFSMAHNINMKAFKYAEKNIKEPTLISI